MPIKKVQALVTINAVDDAMRGALERLLCEVLREEGIRRIRCSTTACGENSTPADLELLRASRVEIRSEVQLG